MSKLKDVTSVKKEDYIKEMDDKVEKILSSRKKKSLNTIKNILNVVTGYVDVLGIENSLGCVNDYVSGFDINRPIIYFKYKDTIVDSIIGTEQSLEFIKLIYTTYQSVKKVNPTVNLPERFEMNGHISTLIKRLKHDGYSDYDIERVLKIIEYKNDYLHIKAWDLFNISEKYGGFSNDDFNIVHISEDCNALYYKDRCIGHLSENDYIKVTEMLENNKKGYVKMENINKPKDGDQIFKIEADVNVDTMIEDSVNARKALIVQRAKEFQIDENSTGQELFNAMATHSKIVDYIKNTFDDLSTPVDEKLSKIIKHVECNLNKNITIQNLSLFGINFKIKGGIIDAYYENTYEGTIVPIDFIDLFKNDPVAVDVTKLDYETIKDMYIAEYLDKSKTQDILSHKARGWKYNQYLDSMVDDISKRLINDSGKIQALIAFIRELSDDMLTFRDLFDYGVEFTINNPKDSFDFDVDVTFKDKPFVQLDSNEFYDIIEVHDLQSISYMHKLIHGEDEEIWNLSDLIYNVDYVKEESDIGYSALSEYEFEEIIDPLEIQCFVNNNPAELKLVDGKNCNITELNLFNKYLVTNPSIKVNSIKIDVTMRNINDVIAVIMNTSDEICTLSISDILCYGLGILIEMTDSIIEFSGIEYRGLTRPFTNSLNDDIPELNPLEVSLENIKKNYKANKDLFDI